MEAFRKYLDEHGVNQQFLARELNISYQALYVKLKGRGNFSIKQALKIKDVLRLTWDEFVEYFG